MASLINDIRDSTEFKSISFSGYKKTDVKKQFMECLLRGKIEPTCYWCAELICAGHFLDIWETILLFIGKHIHSANPKMVPYINQRYHIFKNIIDQGHFLSILELRNNTTIRRLFSEIMIILIYSPKKQSFETLKIDKIEEFDITRMTDRLKAPSINYMTGLLDDKDDPKELAIVINEFAYHISEDSHNMHHAVFWIEWLIEFDYICKSRREPAKCKRRNYPVEPKLQLDIIWIIWDAILARSTKMGAFIEKINRALMELFCIKYTSATSKKRKYLLYYAIELLTEPIPKGVELIEPDKKDMIAAIHENIDLIYKQIKKNECSPNTDYLFMGSDKQKNFENSVKKLEIFRAMDVLSGDSAAMEPL